MSSEVQQDVQPDVHADDAAHHAAPDAAAPDHPPGDADHADEVIHMPAPSLAPFIVGAGAAVLVLGILSPIFLVVGAAVTLFGVWRMAHFTPVDMHAHFMTHLNDRKFAMWIFLASEVMFFTSLIGAFIAFKLNEGFHEVHEILNLPLATFGTSVLIVSSFAVVMGLEAIESNDFRVFRNWMGITLVLGTLFVMVQAFEWYELIDHGIDAEDLFGTAFFVTTGFHGLHVIGGVIWLGLLLVEAHRRHFSAQDALSVELFGLYWHFVDVVWIVLFTVIYLIE